MGKDWVPDHLNRRKPIYMAVVDALEADIASGRLQAGEKLPTQRKLAQQLDVDFTTITRAYKEARKRGLVLARVGRGTFVKGELSQKGTTHAVSSGSLDMGMNMPPVPIDPDVIARMHREMNEVTHRLSTHSLFGYHDFVGSVPEREKAVHWVTRFLPDVSANRLLICSGTQSALLSLVLYLLKPGDTVVSEDLTYPGFRILMQQWGMKHIGLEMDANGIVPASFRRACKENKVSVLYCNPTLHNPTTTTWPKERRQAIANIAREFNVKIIEDDSYRGMAQNAPAPLSAFAPERSYYVIGLAKCLSSALRISFLCVPGDAEFKALALANRATSMMASPITKAMALQLLGSGCADLVVQDILKQTKKRQTLVRDYLPAGSFVADPAGFQVWFNLGAEWELTEYLEVLRVKGIRLIGAGAFSVNLPAPKAVRICLGVPATIEKTEQVLQTIGQTYAAPTRFHSEVV